MLAAISGVILVLTMWKMRDIGGRGVDAFLMSSSLLVLYAGVQSTDTPHAWLYIALLAAAPAAAAIVYALPYRSYKVRIGLAMTMAALVVGAAVVIAFFNQPASDY